VEVPCTQADAVKSLFARTLHTLTEHRARIDLIEYSPILGGVTMTLLKTMTVPVPMSH